MRKVLDWELNSSDCQTADNASEQFVSWITDGLCLICENEAGQPNDVIFGGENNEYEVIDSISVITTVLHHRFPDQFFPYYFINRYNRLTEIGNAFSIGLPPIPGKNPKAPRALHYLEINAAIQAFRKCENLTPKELNAFLYDFGPAYLATQNNPVLPPPRRAWFVMAGAHATEDFELLDNADDNTVSHWRGHRDARRGDLAVVWCASPRAHLHSIWRVIEDGFDDPYSHWYSIIRISRLVRVPPLKIAALKADPVLSKSSLVRSNLQGCSGKYFASDEYAALLDLLTRNGGKVHDIAALDIPPLISGDLIQNERHVEEQLIEPMLLQLGYTANDWTRQYRLRMGRGDRVYPDYLIGVEGNNGNESALLVVEAKYRIATVRDLSEAHLQGRSYALRLRAKWLLLAALEGVWLLSEKNGFSLVEGQHFDWHAFNVDQTVLVIHKLIGKGKLKR